MKSHLPSLLPYTVGALAALAVVAYVGTRSFDTHLSDDVGQLRGGDTESRRSCQDDLFAFYCSACNDVPIVQDIMCKEDMGVQRCMGMPVPACNEQTAKCTECYEYYEMYDCLTSIRPLADMQIARCANGSG